MSGSPPRRPGVVLFSVLVIIAILILVGYQFFHLMNAEFAATVAGNKVLQSRHLAESGLNYTTFVLAHPGSSGLSGDGTSPVVFAPLAYDNEQMFHRLPVVGPDGTRGYFTIVSLREPSDPMAESMGYRYGVEDECGKINLHSLVLTDRDNQAVSVLARLPNMTQEAADSLLKWIKPADDTGSTSSAGAANKYGTVESLEELLLVPNITPRLLLGNDRNRNGRVESDEDDASGMLDPGLARYLTVHSRELDVDSTGQPRVSIAITQQMDAAAVEAMHARLAEVLPPELAQEIIKFQVFGVPPARQGRQMRMTNLPPWAKLADGKVSIDYKHEQFTPQSLRPIASLYDLVVAPNNASWMVMQQNPSQGGGGGLNMTISSINCLLNTTNKEVLRTMLPVLLDKLTIRDTVRYGLERPARININTAPQEVIAAYITTDAEQQKVMLYRPTPETDPAQALLYSTLAWLITEAEVTPANVKNYEQYFNARSQVYRFQAVGYFEGNGPTTRLEAVVDVNGGRPRVLYWRDISILGRGFNFNQNATAP
jgi:hypothetical protein